MLDIGIIKLIFHYKPEIRRAAGADSTGTCVGNLVTRTINSHMPNKIPVVCINLILAMDKIVHIRSNETFLCTAKPRYEGQLVLTALRIVKTRSQQQERGCRL